MLSYRHWIFDLDGTLTVAVHDFEAMRVELGLAPGAAILEAIAQLPAAERVAMHDNLYALARSLDARASNPVHARCSRRCMSAALSWGAHAQLDRVGAHHARSSGPGVILPADSLDEIESAAYELREISLVCALRSGDVSAEPGLTISSRRRTNPELSR